MSHILPVRREGRLWLVFLTKFWNLSTSVIAPQVQNHQPICGFLKFRFNLYDTVAFFSFSCSIFIEPLPFQVEQTHSGDNAKMIFGSAAFAANKWCSRDLNPRLPIPLQFIALYARKRSQTKSTRKKKGADGRGRRECTGIWSWLTEES